MMWELCVYSPVLVIILLVSEATANERPYAVFQTQNLVLFVSVLSVVLLAVIIMAVCVYKPFRAR